jgi:hypothetical protein
MGSPSFFENKSARLRLAWILQMARKLKLPIIKNMFEAFFRGDVI